VAEATVAEVDSVAVDAEAVAALVVVVAALVAEAERGLKWRQRALHPLMPAEMQAVLLHPSNSELVA
jgi:hypothetical protein